MLASIGIVIRLINTKLKWLIIIVVRNIITGKNRLNWIINLRNTIISTITIITRINRIIVRSLTTLNN